MPPPIPERDEDEDGMRERLHPPFEQPPMRRPVRAVRREVVNRRQRFIDNCFGP